MNIELQKAYEIFNLPQKFSLEDLKKSFKKMAKKLHPDKSGQDNELFELLMIAYRKMYEHYEMTKTTKEFNELKQDYKTYTVKEKSDNKQNIEFQEDNGDNKLRNGDSCNNEDFIEKFNKVFSDNKLHDRVVDTGYGNIMDKSSSYREDIEIDNDIGKFNIKTFNKKFDKKEIIDIKNKQLIKYEEPDALISQNDRLPFSELGIKKISDYSGENTSSKQLNYCDYVVAHTTSKLVDTNDDKNIRRRKKYKNVKHIEDDRRNQKFDMTDEEKRRYDAKMRKNERYEIKRVLRQQEMDNQISKHHEKMNKMFLK